ncbi:MAG TPA: ATP-dependent DNA helicase RecG [Patescibacteria group bacterium]
MNREDKQVGLSDKISTLPFVGPVYLRRLEKLGITTIEDLINHVPFRFVDFRESAAISSLRDGDIVNIEGTITLFKNQYTKIGRKLQVAEVEDETGKIMVTWFNQPYLSRVLREGEKVSLSGKIDWFGRKLAMISPEFEVIKEGIVPIHTKGLVPIYSATEGLSSKWIRRRVSDALKRLEIKDYLPKDILDKYNLIDFKQAAFFVHSPTNPQEFDMGRRRLAFNELLFSHLKNLRRKGDWKENKVRSVLKIEDDKVDLFLKNLPFELTSSQKKSMEEIMKDLKSEVPMNRLLEGDVGSGKTVVAAAAMFMAFVNGHKSILMAPTQILAHQHFDTLTKLFAPFKVRVSLVTGGKVQEEVGKSDVYVGTHALIHKKVDLKGVEVVVIDEQHRFGVEQRQHLVNKIGKKKFAPHVLTMTATPIPRTVALTIYGDLALSTLDELPKGRQKITTWIVGQEKRNGAYEWIEKKIEEEKIQVFVICPLIEESHNLTEVKAATSEAEKLKKIFPKRKIGVLHGKQKHEEKEKVLSKFKDGETDILVATPVVEVGIDIPNATIMVIEAADRFGLASLHQLRGRVGRGSKKSYCLAMTESKSEKVAARLAALKRSMSGFELAELDLRLRGPGEVFGLAQHGFAELKVARWTDTDLIKETKELAEKVIENPENFTDLVEIISSKEIAPN